MQKKRLVVLLAVVLVLLALAGIIELMRLGFSTSSEPSSAAVGESASVSESNESAKGPEEKSEEASEVSAEASAEEHAEASAEESAAEQRAIAERQAAELAESGRVMLGGIPLQQAVADKLVEPHPGYASAVGFIGQEDTLPSGCEIVALSVVLDAMGLDASPEEIAEYHLSIGDDLATDYVGDPSWDGGGLPPCIIDAGNSWLEERGAPVVVANLTGTTFDGILDLVALGYPVMVWTTEDLEEPMDVEDVGDGLTWYMPEHCVVVYGVQGDEVLVSDSIQGLLLCDRAEFDYIYESCGSMAAFAMPQ